MAVAMAVACTMMAPAVRAPITRATTLARRTDGTRAASSGCTRLGRDRGPGGAEVVVGIEVVTG